MCAPNEKEMRLLGLSRNCLTFKMFLVYVFMRAIELGKGAGIDKLRLACLRKVELDGDCSQITELRPWFAVRFVFS
jgi:hypothetical protein